MKCSSMQYGKRRKVFSMAAMEFIYGRELYDNGEEVPVWRERFGDMIFARSIVWFNADKILSEGRRPGSYQGTSWTMLK